MSKKSTALRLKDHKSNENDDDSEGNGREVSFFKFPSKNLKNHDQMF